MNTGGNLGGTLSPTLTPWLADQFGWSAALGDSRLHGFIGWDSLVSYPAR